VQLKLYTNYINLLMHDIALTLDDNINGAEISEIEDVQSA